ncbi:MAG: DnaD domain protein [Bacilli bacterium]
MLNSSSKYQVIKKGLVSNGDYILVSKYYQPVIGPVATLIYVNFLNEVVDKNESIENSISKLQVYLNTNIDKIYYALKILSKANLIEVYKSNDDEKFIFEVNKPYSSEEFFANSNLSNLLLKQIGEQLYEELKVSDAEKNFNLSNYSKLNVTKDIEIKQNNDSPYHKYFRSLKLSNSEEEIEELVNVSKYNKLTKIEIETILPICKTESHLNLKKFSQAIRVIKENSDEDTNFETINNKDDIVVVFDKYNSELFLSKLSNGRSLTNSERILIDDLRTKYKLVDPVINVLIDYVLLINDKNLNRNFTLAIAANWSRKNFTTSTQAMDFVREYNKKKNRTLTDTEGNIVPEWLNKDLEESVEEKTIPNQIVKDSILIDDKNAILEEKKLDISKDKNTNHEVEEAFDIFSNFEGV